MSSTTRSNGLLAGGLKRWGATRLFGMALAGLLLAGSHLATAQSRMIVDRGLPTANLNAAGANRSNVSWGETDLIQNTFDGDTFTVPGTGTVSVDTIRLWFVGYGANNDANLNNDTFLGNQSFGNLSLYVGAVGNPLNRVSQASFATPGSDATNNLNVVATRVQYGNGEGTELDYGNAGGTAPYLTIVQLDFKNLNLSFAGGTQVQFGMRTDGDYTLSHASNAALSGSPQDQADGKFSQFRVDTDPATATFVSTLDSYPSLWDKSSDINVQVFTGCIQTGFFRDGINLTAAQIGGDVTGPLDATGCNIGVYYNANHTGNVTGADIYGANYFGVVVDGGAGRTVAVNVTNSSIHDIGESPLNGAQHGNAVYYYGYGTPGTVTGIVSGNTVSNYQKGGIIVNGANAAVTVTANTVTGEGPVTYIAQNGIQIGYGATAKLTGNTVSDNYYTPASWVACGLLFYQAGGVKASGNTLFNNERDQCNFGKGGGHFNPAP